MPGELGNWPPPGPARCAADIEKMNRICPSIDFSSVRIRRLTKCVMKPPYCRSPASQNGSTCRQSACTPANRRLPDRDQSPCSTPFAKLPSIRLPRKTTAVFYAPTPPASTCDPADLALQGAYHATLRRSEFRVYAGQTGLTRLKAELQQNRIASMGKIG
jgi:hypothetical protein